MISTALVVVVALLVSPLVESSSQKPIKCRLYSKCNVDLSTLETLQFSEHVVNTTDPNVFGLDPPKFAEFREDGNETYKIIIIPVLIGRAKIEVLTTATGEKRIITDVIVEKPNRMIDVVFEVYLWVYCGLISFCMGASIDTEVVKKYFRHGQKEIGLAFFCQYAIMPLTAYVVGRVFESTAVDALGLFIYGITPGAYESSEWSTVLDGNVELNSIAATMSTFFSFIMMPIWLYTLGDSLMKQVGFVLSLYGLLLNLCVVIFPLFLGHILGNQIDFIKKVSTFVHKVLVTIVPVILSIALHVASKFYSFVYHKPVNIITGTLISYVGYIIGGSLAWLLGLSGDKIRSISIETGVQNTLLAMLIVNWNFPSPDSDIVLLVFVPILFQACSPLGLCRNYKKVKACIEKRRNKRKNAKAAARRQTPESAAEKGENESILLEEKSAK